MRLAISACGRPPRAWRDSPPRLTPVRAYLRPSARRSARSAHGRAWSRRDAPAPSRAPGPRPLAPARPSEVAMSIPLRPRPLLARQPNESAAERKQRGAPGVTECCRAGPKTAPGQRQDEREARSAVEGRFETRAAPISSASARARAPDRLAAVLVADAVVALEFLEDQLVQPGSMPGPLSTTCTSSSAPRRSTSMPTLPFGELDGVGQQGC